MYRAVIGLILNFASLGAQAALLGRAPATPGGTDYQAFYDDSLNITWLADANYTQTSGFDGDGSITWFEADTWLSMLNANAYLGLSSWRLPKIEDAGATCHTVSFGCLSVNMIADEMTNLFYKTLGNVGYYTALGLTDNGYYYPENIQPTTCGDGLASCLTNVGPFSNFQASYYWTGNTSTVFPGDVWHFNFQNGVQSSASGSNTAFAWAVHDGDPLAVVPLPAAAWLLSSALGILGLFRRALSICVTSA